MQGRSAAERPDDAQHPPSAGSAGVFRRCRVLGLAPPCTDQVGRATSGPNRLYRPGAPPTVGGALPLIGILLYTGLLECRLLVLNVIFF